jgi:hypothetical protein
MDEIPATVCDIRDGGCLNVAFFSGAPGCSLREGRPAKTLEQPSRRAAPKAERMKVATETLRKEYAVPLVDLRWGRQASP